MHQCQWQIFLLLLLYISAKNVSISIYLYNMNTVVLFVQVVVDTSLESPAGLAIDWVTNKLYWTDAGKQLHFT